MSEAHLRAKHNVFIPTKTSKPPPTCDSMIVSGASSAWQSWASLMFMVYIVSMGSSIFSTAMHITAKEFSVDMRTMLHGLTAYTIGIASGSIIFRQLSRWVDLCFLLLIGMAMFVFLNMLLGFSGSFRLAMVGRFASGFMGSAPVALAPDFALCLFFASGDRAVATVVYATVLASGPPVGVLSGEFAMILSSSDWRWTVWISALLGIVSIPIAFGRRLQGAVDTRSTSEKPTGVGLSLQGNATLPSQRDRAANPLPLTEKLAVATCASFIYGHVHVLLLAYPMSFEIYRTIPYGVCALPFVAVISGFVVACWRLSLRFGGTRSLSRKGPQSDLNKSLLKEMVSGCAFAAVGMLIFASTSSRNITVWPQVLSGTVIGYGLVTAFASALVRLDRSGSPFGLSMDASLLRGLSATAFPVFVIPLYATVGVQWASGLLAVIPLIAAICPLLMPKM